MSKKTKVIIGVLIAAGICGGVYGFSYYENVQATNLINKVDNDIVTNYDDTIFSNPTSEGINEEFYNNLENQINTMETELNSASNHFLLYSSTKTLLTNNEVLLNSFKYITNLLYNLNSINTAITEGSIPAARDAISNIEGSSAYTDLNNLATSSSLQSEVGDNNAKLIIQLNNFIRNYINKVKSIVNNSQLIESNLPETSLSELVNSSSNNTFTTSSTSTSLPVLSSYEDTALTYISPTATTVNQLKEDNPEVLSTFESFIDNDITSGMSYTGSYNATYMDNMEDTLAQQFSSTYENTSEVAMNAMKNYIGYAEALRGYIQGKVDALNSSQKECLLAYELNKLDNTELHNNFPVITSNGNQQEYEQLTEVFIRLEIVNITQQSKN